MNATSPRRPLLIAATTALLLGSALAAAAPAQAADSGLGDIENSLVHVYTEYTGYVYYPTDDGWQWSDEVTAGATCTGWFASDDGYIATAGHCVQPELGRRAILKQFLADWDAEDLLADALTSWTVEGYEEGSDIDRTVEVVQPDGADDPVIDTWTTAQVLDFQDFENGDAALLKVAGVSGVEPLSVSGSTPEVGDEIVSIGFPGTVQQVVDVQRLGASFKTGTVSSRQVTDGGVPVTEINAQVSGGMSGGPTIDAEGHVIGINSFGITGEPQSFNFVTDTEALAQFLTSHGVDFDAAAASATGDRRDETGTSDAETAGAQTAPAGRGASAGAATPAADGGAPLLLVVAVVALGILVLAGGGAAVVAVVVTGRRRARADAAATAAPAAPGSVAPAPTTPAPAAPAAPGYAEGTPVAAPPAFAGAVPAGFAPPSAAPAPVPTAPVSRS